MTGETPRNPCVSRHFGYESVRPLREKCEAQELTLGDPLARRVRTITSPSRWSPPHRLGECAHLGTERTETVVADRPATKHPRLQPSFG